MFNVFGDESSDEKCERVFAVAGLFGGDDNWRNLRDRWIEVTEDKEFHGVEWDDSPRYTLLAHALADSRILGFGAAISVENLSGIFPEAVEQFPYYFCFGRVIYHFAKITRLCLWADRTKFTFHQNLAVQKSAAELYHDMLTYPEWNDREFIADEISYATNKTVEIQAADLWAREVRKHVETTLTGDLGPHFMRPALRILRQSRRFGFDAYERSYFESMKQNWKQWHRGATDGQYSEWRQKNKLRDSGSARIRFLIYLNAIHTKDMLASRSETDGKEETPRGNA